VPVTPPELDQAKETQLQPQGMGGAWARRAGAAHATGLTTRGGDDHRRQYAHRPTARRRPQHGAPSLTPGWCSNSWTALRSLTISRRAEPATGDWTPNPCLGCSRPQAALATSLTHACSLTKEVRDCAGPPSLPRPRKLMTSSTRRVSMQAESWTSPPLAAEDDAPLFACFRLPPRSLLVPLASLLVRLTMRCGSSF
jgi:hypothetical protein